jgi:hypothetical protein
MCTYDDLKRVRMLIYNYVNHLYGETPTDIRMGAPPKVTNFSVQSVTLSETQRKGVI